MYSLLHLVCMDAGLLGMRGAPGWAWDTPEALSTCRSLLWTPWSDESVPCLSLTRRNRVEQQPILQGAASQCAWNFGGALLVDLQGEGKKCKHHPGHPRRPLTLLHPQ